MYNVADALYISLISIISDFKHLWYCNKNQSDLVRHSLLPKIFWTYYIIIKALSFVNIYRIILIEFNTANKVTPTSANTAAHIFVNPATTNIITATFINNEKIIFCHNILFVFLDILIASEIDSILSFINTTSAASIAASEPTPPMAIPISALAKTGASLIPSPTNNTLLILVPPTPENALEIITIMNPDKMEENECTFMPEYNEIAEQLLKMEVIKETEETLEGMPLRELLMNEDNTQLIPIYKINLNRVENVPELVEHFPQNLLKKYT